MMKRSTRVLLIGIIILGVWFRLFGLPKDVWFLRGFDEHRDSLVARHIVSNHEWLWRGPFASGSQNELMNSPFYYYYISLLWFFTRNPIAMLYLWAILQSASIPLAYMVGKRMWDEKLGLLAALFVAVQPEMISMARNFSQPFLLPFFSLLFLYMVWMKKPATAPALCLAIVILTTPMHFHYGSLVLLPLGFVWIGVNYRNFLRHNKDSYALVAPVLTAEACFFLWIWLTYYAVPFDQFRFLLWDTTNHSNAYSTVLAKVLLYIRDFTWWDGWNIKTVSATGALAIGAAYAYRTQAKNAFFTLRYTWFLVLGISAILIAALHKTPSNTYLLSILPIIVLLCAVSVRAFWSKHAIWAAASGALFLWIFLPKAVIQTRPNSQPSTYIIMNEAAHAIANDYTHQPSYQTKSGLPNLSVAAFAADIPYDGWAVGGLWFFLENIYGKQLVKLTESGPNFYPLVSKPKYVYVLCELAMMPYEHCIGHFRSVRPYLTEGETLVYEADQYTVWRFTVENEIPDGLYTVYPWPIR